MKILILVLIQFISFASHSMTCAAAVGSLSFRSVDIHEYSYSASQVQTAFVASQSKADQTVIIKRKGFQWRSVWSPDGQNLQGDPRRLIILVGDRIAGFFKFEMLNKNSMQAPRGNLFTDLILKANRHLKSIEQEEIAVRFKDSPIDKPIHFLDYLTDSMIFTLPVASGGHYLVHDFLHYGAILLPKAILENLGQKSLYFLRFHREVEFAVRNYPKEVQDKILRINKIMLMRHESGIDAVTANVSATTVMRILKPGRPDHMQQIENKVLGPLKKHTVDSYLQLWEAEIVKAIEDLKLDLMDPRILSQETSVAVSEAVIDLSVRFRADLHHTAKKPFEMTGEELIKFIDQRRHALSTWDGQ